MGTRSNKNLTQLKSTNLPKYQYQQQKPDPTSEQQEEEWSESAYGQSDEYDPYEFDSEEQGISGYLPGGYPPLSIGQTIINRYVLVKKIGYGNFSTVWLARDFKLSAYVTLKIMKSSTEYTEASLQQIQILQKIQRTKFTKQSNQEGSNKQQTQRPILVDNDKHLLKLLNTFVYRGPYGRHFCFAFEILGNNLRHIMKRHHYRGIPLTVCKNIFRQLLEGLDFLHRECGIIHTDLKPENILVTLKDKQIRQLNRKGTLHSDKTEARKAKQYRQAYGYKVDSDSTSSSEDDLYANVDVSKLTKCQKKNLRKLRKKHKQKKKAQKILQKEQREKAKNAIKGLMFEESDRHRQQKQNSSDQLTEDSKIKIVDLGNACWRHHHFSRLIQTREYRAPEVIVGLRYDTPVDIWSAGCILYEMLTGEVLFELGENMYLSRNKLHLASIQEKIGLFPKSLRTTAKKSRHYFGKKGQQPLKGVDEIPHSPICTYLIHKLKLKVSEAECITDLIHKMLEPVSHKRITARQALQHPWMTSSKRRSKMSKAEYRHYLIEQEQQQEEGESTYLRQSLHKPQSEAYDGDCSDPEQSDQENTKQWSTTQGIRMISDIKLVDRSFTDLGYIGYQDGISLEELDYANWQFK